VGFGWEKARFDAPFGDGVRSLCRNGERLQVPELSGACIDRSSRRPTSDRVDLKQSAVVTGDIATQRISIDDGLFARNDRSAVICHPISCVFSTPVRNPGLDAGCLCRSAKSVNSIKSLDQSHFGIELLEQQRRCRTVPPGAVPRPSTRWSGTCLRLSP